MNGMCRINLDRHHQFKLSVVKGRHTSSSTPDSTPSSRSRSSHVLITLGAVPVSRTFTPCTLRTTSDPMLGDPTAAELKKRDMD